MSVSTKILAILTIATIVGLSSLMAQGSAVPSREGHCVHEQDRKISSLLANEAEATTETTFVGIDCTSDDKKSPPEGYDRHEANIKLPAEREQTFTVVVSVENERSYWYFFLVLATVLIVVFAISHVVVRPIIVEVHILNINLHPDQDLPLGQNLPEEHNRIPLVDAIILPIEEVEAVAL